MDPRITRALAAVSAITLVAVAADFVRAQQPDQPVSTAPTAAGPPPPLPPSVVSPAQQTPNSTPPVNAAPVSTPLPEAQDNGSQDSDDASNDAPPAPQNAAALPPPPPGPKPVRSPVAIMQVLDKVTADTLRFAAPVGQRIRYKTLIFTVKACETRGVDDPQAQPSAYVLIDSTVRGGAGDDASREVFKGWMFTNAPAVHPFEHPIYDAWVIACSAAAPSA